LTKNFAFFTLPFPLSLVHCHHYAKDFAKPQPLRRCITTVVGRIIHLLQIIEGKHQKLWSNGCPGLLIL